MATITSHHVNIKGMLYKINIIIYVLYALSRRERMNIFEHFKYACREHVLRFVYIKYKVLDMRFVYIEYKVLGFPGKNMF